MTGPCWASGGDYVKAVVLSKLDRECGDNVDARRRRLRELLSIEGLSEGGRRVLQELLEATK